MSAKLQGLLEDWGAAERSRSAEVLGHGFH